MIYAILSDIHANADALRGVLADALQSGAEALVCLGDVVGYGPAPAEAVALTKSNCTVVLRGNHDAAVSGELATDAFNSLASDAVARHRAALSPDDLAWLRSLPLTTRLEGAIAAHGDFIDPGAFYYVDDTDSAAQNFAATSDQLMFVGHTHVPSIALVGESGTVYLASPQDFTLEPNKRYIVNPGSVGYPREENGVCRSSYVLYDSAAGTVRFRYLPFSVASVMQRGRGSRRRFLVSLALAFVAVLLAAWTTVFAIHLRAGGEKSEKRPILLAREELALSLDDLAVTPNLKVSGPVVLRIEFRDAQGRLLPKDVEQMVKSSYCTQRHVPTSAAKAIFSVYAATTNGLPEVSLRPTADAQWRRASRKPEKTTKSVPSH